MKFKLRLLAAVLAGAASAAVVPRTSSQAGPETAARTASRQTADEACGRVADAQLRGAQSVAPSLALDCLNSVPLDVERDVALVDYITPLVSFQSNLAFLKAPPAEYKAASGRGEVDIIGGLEDIKKEVITESYKSQYEFTMALQELVRRAGDSHFTLGPALNQVFMFARDVSLVSISPDGRALPEIYEVGDFIRSQSAGYTPSPVVELDDEPIQAYLTNLSIATGREHDLDAGFNNLFPSKAKVSTGFTTADYFYVGSYLSLPDESKLSLANGTTLRFLNLAVPNANLYGITTGDDLHQAAEVPFATPGRHRRRDTAPAPPSTRRAATAAAPPCRFPHGDRPRPQNWPVAVDEHVDKYAGGYFLSGSPHNDTAVLQMASFESLYPGLGSDTACGVADMVEFHRFVTSFVSRFREEGKTRLVVDLSANGGGYEAILADVFDQLFPGQVPGFRYRARATPAMAWMANATFREGETLGVALFDDLHADWPETFGPEKIAADDFTTEMFRDVLQERALVGVDDTVFTEPLVQPEDMVVVTDGDCHSSCALLVGWLARDMGVRTVAMGGRPVEAPMQAIGGTKGGAPYPWDLFQAVEQLAVEMSGSDTAEPADVKLPSPGSMPIRVFDNPVNSMDIWHNSSSTSMPVHFLWEAANCRLFYTADTLQMVEEMWKAVADVAWHGAKCAPGSTANADGTMGDKPPAFKDAPMPATRSLRVAGSRSVSDVRNLDPRPWADWESTLVRSGRHWQHLASARAADGSSFWEHD